MPGRKIRRDLGVGSRVKVNAGRNIGGEIEWRDGTVVEMKRRDAWLSGAGS